VAFLQLGDLLGVRLLLLAQRLLEPFALALLLLLQDLQVLNGLNEGIMQGYRMEVLAVLQLIIGAPGEAFYELANLKGLL